MALKFAGHVFEGGGVTLGFSEVVDCEILRTA